MSFDFVLKGFDEILLEVIAAVSPILIIFLLFILVFKKPASTIISLFRGIAFAFIGLALFLQGVKIGFMPVGMEMGSILGAMPNRWILIPLGFILGFTATLAEPAVRILSRQVERSSSGSIRSTFILLTLCFAVGLFISLGMLRVIYGIPFYYIIIPGYLLAIVLMFFSKPSFTAIAFDSGGVATGPMTVTFIMALAIGAADAIEGRDSVVDGFGLIALVALAPILIVMLVGFFYPENNDDCDDDDNDVETTECSLNESSDQEEDSIAEEVLLSNLPDQEGQKEPENNAASSGTEGFNDGNRPEA